MNTENWWNEIDKSVKGEAWHGPSVMEALEGVSATEAAVRIGSAHTIWELAVHIALWMEEVAERLGGRYHAELAGDFEMPADRGVDAWEHARAAITAAAGRVQKALADLPADRLQAEVRPGLTHAELVSGLAQHNTYHAGQIALLRKLVTA